jgi:TonB-linked SusC/RagA family outer membrane protein
MVRGAVCGISVGVILCSSGAGAQGPQPLRLASREPAFYAIVGTHIERAEAGSFAALRARLVLRLRNATIPEALTAIEEQTSLRFAYKPSILPSGTTVSLDAGDITVAAALTQILLDADVDVEIAPYGQATLVARNRAATQRQPSDSIVVRGTITDSTTHNPISGAVIRVAGGNQSTVSGVDGTYSITRLSPGTYRFVVRRLGYAVVTIEVTAPAAGVYTRNIALAPVPTVLDQVVTTVTGNQRLSTIGNTISTINADSLVPNTPVTSLSDIIDARAPGVQVINTGGIIGVSPQIYIRGAGSLSRSNQPLLYIDGVRASNTTATSPTGNNTASGSFNDIIPEDIESIEIVKGPSAATLYGTDAANGVILVTTKHGTTGAARWSMFGEGGGITMAHDLIGYNYTGWGRAPDGTTTNSCTLLTAQAGGCTQDSVTHFSPLRVPSLTPFGTGNSGGVGAQVSGGSKTVRYFISGDYASEVGAIQDPPTDQRILDSLIGPQAGGGNTRHPNSVSKYNGRVNLTTPLGQNADITIAVGYLSQTSHVPNGQISFQSGGGAGYQDQYDGWFSGIRPATYFSVLQGENTQHLTSSVTAHWLPLSWLTARAVIGIDASNDGFDEVRPAAAAPVTGQPGGYAYDQRGNTTLYSVDLGATARTPVTSHLVFSTSAGVQYHRTSVAIAAASATQLTVGGQAVGSGVPSGLEIDSGSVVAGAYGEEQIAFNDRLFLTGGVRVDGANDFGQQFNSATYPKGSVSWLVSKEPFFPAIPGLSLLRLRAAYGESGTQPGLVLTTLQTAAVTIDGVLQSGTTLATLGNPHVEPERQKEFEAGADLDLVHDRLHLEFTYYKKRNVNALYQVPLGISFGSINSIEENIGEIANWGYESTLSVALLAQRAIAWDVSFNGSVNHNQVVSLGPEFQPIYGQFGSASIVAGYPMYSLFAQPYTYRDINHDGIIEPNEVTVATANRYYAPTIPPLQLTAATHVGLFNYHVQIGALFDYRGGFDIANSFLSDQCFDNTAFATISRSASLASQAVCVADNYYNNVRGTFSNGSFIRFRELSLTYALPDGIASHLRARSLSVTLSARNLALWTHFNGGDPETAPEAVGAPGLSTFSEGGGIPSAQYWLARVNIGL